MPIYEYRCPDCGHEFECIQSFRDDPITDCPECKGESVKKKISLSAFALKGGGWYKDHYGLKSSGGSTDSGASSSSSSDD
jgi:putative FmdB family regulatory protein